MILTGLITMIVSVMTVTLAALSPSMETMSGMLGNYWASVERFGGVASSVNRILPLDTLAEAIAALLVIEGLIIAWGRVMWLLKKFHITG
jgi:hypothetical protein